MQSSSRLPTRVVDAPWFNRTVLVAILLAGALAGIETSVALLERHGAALRFLDRAVLAVFIAEIALRMAACGRKPWHFFRDGWNIFDFLIVVICCLPLHSQFAAVLRLARGLRLLRLVSALPKLQLLAGALLKSLAAMGYVSLLLSLMFYIYAVGGVHLFAAHAPEHFGTLGTALLSLFKIITLDNWSDILAAARPAAPLASIVYFVSFILLGTMIMLNLFIGIIMNSMSEMHAEIEGRKQQASAAPGVAPDPAPGSMRALESQIVELRREIRELARGGREPPGTRPRRKKRAPRDDLLRSDHLAIRPRLPPSGLDAPPFLQPVLDGPRLPCARLAPGGKPAGRRAIARRPPRPPADPHRAAGQECDLPVHGRRAVPARVVRLQTTARGVERPGHPQKLH